MKVISKSNKNIARVYLNRDNEFDTIFYGDKRKKINSYLELPHNISTSSTRMQAVEKAKKEGAKFIIMDHDAGMDNAIPIDEVKLTCEHSPNSKRCKYVRMNEKQIVFKCIDCGEYFYEVR